MTTLSHGGHQLKIYRDAPNKGFAAFGAKTGGCFWESLLKV
jgi:hypothetical protein